MADGWLIKGERDFEQRVEDTGAAHVYIKASDISLGAPVDYATLYDQVNDNLAYAGKALPGTLTSAANWQVRELTFGVDGDVTVKYADGNSNLDNVWDDRAILSYS